MKPIHTKENFLSPIYLACGKENIRPIMNYVHFIGDYMYATNAHILVKQHIDFCNVIDKKKLDGKIIHRDSFQKILKADRVIAKDDCVECHFFKENSTQTFKYGKEDGKLPDYESVLENQKIKDLSCVQINPKFIEIAAKCIYDDNSSDGLIFTFLEKNMLRIESKNYENQLAMVMTILR